MIPEAGRELVRSDLTLEGERYSMDLDHLEDVLEQGGERARMFILCSPHNPVGRVWGHDELRRLCDICLRHSVVVVSDEIHHDIVLPPHRHEPMAAFSAEAAKMSVTCTAASKTFNLAGLGLANMIVPSSSLRERIGRAMQALGLGLGGMNIFGLTATEAAYRRGEAWLDEALSYISGNYRLLVDTLAEKLPEVRCLPLEGTYLPWLDCRKLRYEDAEIKQRLLRRGRVWLDDGPMFGSGGEGFQRINIACPRTLLSQALERLVDALSPSRSPRPR